MNQPYQYDTELKLGQNRGKPRVWIEGKALAAAGFLPGTKFRVVFQPNDGMSAAHVALYAVDVDDAVCEGDDVRKVSGKERESGPHPIIDMNTSELDKVFPGVARIAVRMTPGQIVITPARTLAQKAKRVATAVAVGLFVGAGLLSQAAKAAGFDTRAAVEVNEDYAKLHDENHGGYMMNSCISDACVEDAAKLIGPVGLLHAGIPCEPFSVARRNTGNARADKTLVPETHELGDMTFWALRAVDIFNPHTCVFEEVPQYLESGAGQILLHALRRMGYTVDWRLINPMDYGAMTARKRAVIVATTFDSVDWPVPLTDSERPVLSMASILHPVDDVRCEWFTRETKPWPWEHWEKMKERGNGLISQRVAYTDTKCPTITKRYFAGQGANPVVQHPDHPETLRWFTIDEVKQIMGLPADYFLGEAKTIAGEGLGQGVEVSSFTQIIRSVTRRAESQLKAA
jgi:DNA (cytosine-5)-methyltransferase 1